MGSVYVVTLRKLEDKDHGNATVAVTVLAACFIRVDYQLNFAHR